MNKNRLVTIESESKPRLTGYYKVQIKRERHKARTYVVDVERAKCILELITNPLIELEDGLICVYGVV